MLVLQLRSGSKIRHDDIFYDGSGVHIIRLALSPILSDITLIEKTIHTHTAADSVGFKGHLKNGGSPALQERYVYGCSLLVIPDLAKLHLQVAERYRNLYAAELQQHSGREGRVVLPPAPSTSFVRPPCEDSGAFVLGGPYFEFKRGLISVLDAQARGVSLSEEVSLGEAEVQSDSLKCVEWNGQQFGACIYFSGKTLATCRFTEAMIEAMGGRNCIFSCPPGDKNRMTLLVDFGGKRSGPKYAYAVAKNVPVITKEQLIKELTTRAQKHV